jgi:CheY-like chemotaxis protein
MPPVLESAVRATYPFVLIVDDEVDDWTLSERQLRHLNVERHTSRSVEEAAVLLARWALLGQGQPVIVVLDLMYPDDPEPGLTFLEQVVRRVVSVPAHTRVIVHSADAEPAVIERARLAGALDYVVKGQGGEHLLEAVEFACGRDVRTARTLCEVVDVDFGSRRILVAVEGTGGWTAQRSFDIDWCPAGARFSGATFYADSYKRLTATGVELVLKTAEVDGPELRRALAEVLRPLE